METRIKKIGEENLDGVILAAAGIKRLGLNLGNRIFYLDKEIMLPSPTQAILAIEIRENDERMESILKGISHRETEIQARVERDFLAAVGGSYCTCRLLLSGVEDKIIVEGLLGSER